MKKFKIAVVYFFVNGLKMILSELQQLVERGGEVNVLMGNYINWKTFKSLVFAFKDVNMAQSRQPNNLISSEDWEEMKRVLISISLNISCLPLPRLRMRII